MAKRNDKKAVEEVSVVEDINVTEVANEVVKTNETVEVLTDDEQSVENGGQGVIEKDAVVNDEPVQSSSHISNVFQSDSEEARHYIMELLSDKESHKKQEIVAYINEKAGKNFSDSVIINTLRNLVNAGDLMQLERGSYQLGSGIGLVSKLLLFITNTKRGLDKITTMSLSDIKAEDLVIIDDVKKLKDMLNSMYEKLGTN